MITKNVSEEIQKKECLLSKIVDPFSELSVKALEENGMIVTNYEAAANFIKNWKIKIIEIISED